MSSQLDQAVAQSFHLSLRQKGMFLAVLSAIFLAAMDQTVVATALPTIARDLHGLAHLPWVITAYLLSSTVTLPIYGKVGDLVGRKKVLLFAVTFFLLGSILSGFSWSLWSLVAFRALQGIGGGGIIVTAVASISDFIPLQQRGKYQGLVGAAFGLATLVGPFLGGFLVQEVGWRWIFYVNIPFGIYCLAIIAWIFPNRAREKVAFDKMGALSLLAGLTSLVLLVELGVDGIISGILLVVLIASLIGVLRHSQRHSEPILSLRFFRHRTFSISVAVSFFVGVALLGSVSFLPTYYQDVRGFTPTQSGLEMLYLLAGMLITSIVIGRLISHLGSFRWFHIMGTACMALALGLLSRFGKYT